MAESGKKTGIVSKIIITILIVIAAIVLLLASIVLYKAYKYPNRVPDIFGYKPMIVLSGSMETSIFTGDLVFVKEVDPDTLKKNDIIAFRNEEDTVTTHRIVEVVSENGERSFKTKGDNNNTEDANIVPAKDVEGVYITRIAGFGNFLMFMQQPIGLVFVILVILVVGLIWLYFVNRKEVKKQKFKDEEERKEFEEFKRLKQQGKK